MLDATHFPGAARYLEALPHGVDSYPACRSRADVVEAAWRQFGESVRERGLGGPVADVLRGSYRGDTWIPEVHAQATLLTVRDVAFDSDDAYFDWADDVNRALFDRPVFRAMMRMLSPTVVVMGATKRWKVFHEGTTLTTTGLSGSAKTRAIATVELTYPRGLLSDLYVRGLARSFRVVLVGARAKDPEVEISGRAPGRAVFTLAWKG